MPVGGASSSETSAAGNPLENRAFLTAPQTIFPGLRAQGVLALGDWGVLVTRSDDIATKHDLPACERGVGEVDVDVSLGEPPGQLTKGRRPVSTSITKTSRASADPHPGALKRGPASGHGLIVEEQVHDTPALTGEGRQAMDGHTGLAGDLPQPGQLARPVLENHCQVCGHRIVDSSTAPGIRVIRSSPAGSAPPSPALPVRVITAGSAAMRYLVTTGP